MSQVEVQARQRERATEEQPRRALAMLRAEPAHACWLLRIISPRLLGAPAGRAGWRADRLRRSGNAGG